MIAITNIYQPMIDGLSDWPTIDRGRGTQWAERLYNRDTRRDPTTVERARLSRARNNVLNATDDALAGEKRIETERPTFGRNVQLISWQLLASRRTTSEIAGSAELAASSVPALSGTNLIKISWCQRASVMRQQIDHAWSPL